MHTNSRIPSKELISITDNPHEHTHVCPLCEKEPDNQDGNSYYCSTTDCPIKEFRCLGTVENTTVTYDTLRDFMQSTWGTKSLSKVHRLLEQPTSEYSDEEETAVRLTKYLREVDTSNMKQARATGERVLEINSEYVPWSQVLWTEVETENSDGEPIDLLVTLPSYTPCSETEVEPMTGVL